MIPDSTRTVAQQIIGRETGEDWKIEPTQHAERLRERAPQLAAILESSEVSTEARRYERSDKEAVTIQNQYKVLVSRANWFVFYSSVSSALVLAANGWFPAEGDTRRVAAVVAFGVAAVLCAGLAKMWLTQVEGNQLFERWMESRAAAETMRLAYFRLVATMKPSAVGAPSAAGPAIELLQLEYFRRFNLDVQLAYYAGRGAQHREASAGTVRLSSYAALTTMLGSGFAAGFGAAVSELASLAILGVVGAALASLAANREALSQDKRNAERYKRTLFSLEEINKDLDSVRRAAAAGDSDTVAKFVDAVNDELSLEHRQWLKEIEGASKPVRELKQALKKFESKASNEDAPEDQVTGPL